MTSTGSTDLLPLKVYWQPGCSSCLKTKEFLIANGHDFVSVNVLEDEVQQEAQHEAFAGVLEGMPAEAAKEIAEDLLREEQDQDQGILEILRSLDLGFLIF